MLEATIYAASVEKRRLDTLLCERGLFESRSKAAAAVLAGDVRLADGRRADKPGQLVVDDLALDVERGPRFVSRGGIKLANAIAELDVPVEGRECLDVGAATGGFTDCLLQLGAAHITAVDVGYGALDWRLRNDDRVTVLERTNARTLVRGALPRPPDLIAIDVSFISVTKVLPAVLASAAERFDCLALVKPQFELGRERVPKGGVVASADDRREALVTAGRAATELGYAVCGYASSGLPGPAGNRETFVWIAEAGRAGAEGDFETAARRAEP